MVPLCSMDLWVNAAQFKLTVATYSPPLPSLPYPALFYPTTPLGESAVATAQVSDTFEIVIEIPQDALRL